MSKPDPRGAPPPAKPPASRPLVVDVRPEIAQGGNPLAKIVAALGRLRKGQALQVITPFLPSPLIEKLQADGFTARPERRADGGWQTTFVRETCQK